MEIKIIDHTKIDTLRHRETAQQLLQTINQTQDEPVTLNFSEITFASRGFLHELLIGLKDREINYKDTNDEIKFMIKITFRKPELTLETEKKIKGIKS